MTRELPLNNGWEYTGNPVHGFYTGEEMDAESVCLPHTGTVLPYNYTNEDAYQYVSGYRHRLELPPLMGGRRLFVRFSGAAQHSVLYLNGVPLLTHSCGYTAFTAELTSGVQTGENWLGLELDSRETLDQPPFGNEIDYLTYQGLYRGCTLIITGPSFIADAFLHTRSEHAYVDLYSVGFASTASLSILDQGGAELASGRFRLLDAAETTLAYPAGLPIPEKEVRSCSLKLSCPGIRRWSPDHPHLYTAVLRLEDDGGAVLDEKRQRFGFRDAEFRQDGFFLNEEKLVLRGLDRHQSFPYVGYAMPDNVQRQDADILRHELGLNVVRTSHYPQSEAFLNRCDEIGLLVFTEIPGWQHIGGEAWKEQAVRNTDDMIAQNRNHPCIILWGVRINESQDDDALYRRTNELAHALDPWRQTGGVRCIRHSHLLEDVYTYNDFVHDGYTPGLSPRDSVTEEHRKPYLVTEYNGHMFPTKSSDDVSHRQEHALRHARVLDDMYGMDDIGGCIGWCAFDYNTHCNFGSGDRICYHGVMDMFRNPKPAAAVYASQTDRTPVLELSSSPDKGDWPASVMKEIWAFTNADSVRLYRDQILIREFFPDRQRFPNLPHPPVRIDDFSGPELETEEHLTAEGAAVLRELWRCRDVIEKSRLLKLLRRKTSLVPEQVEPLWQRYAMPLCGPSYRFEAVLNGTGVLSRTFAPSGEVTLHLQPDRLTLHEDGMWDAVLVRITAEDSYGNRLWYAAEPLHLETAGVLERIGPEWIPLRGGAAGVWLRTTGKTGKAALRVSCFGILKRLDFLVE